LGAAAACTALAARPASAASRGGLTLRFVGMMAFIERTDGSFLVATPGQEPHGHMNHHPFLMARAGTAVAKALDMHPAPGVVPGAFDMSLADSRPEEFVYRSLENATVEVVSGDGGKVANGSVQMAQMNRILPGHRLRNDLEHWATTTVSLRGGRLQDSAAHPDAGKTWSFGTYRQQVTDAAHFIGAERGTVLRVNAGQQVLTFTGTQGAAEDLWVFSAALPTTAHTPTAPEHSAVAFQFFQDAPPIVATCDEAVGREVPDTALPCTHPSSAGIGLHAEGRRFPPYSEICIMFAFLLRK
jgi:hypothetical protein